MKLGTFVWHTLPGPSPWADGGSQAVQHALVASRDQRVPTPNTSSRASSFNRLLIAEPTRVCASGSRQISVLGEGEKWLEVFRTLTCEEACQQGFSVLAVVRPNLVESTFYEGLVNKSAALLENCPVVSDA